MEKRTLVIIPAFNEENNIAFVLDEIRRNIPGCDILVVNDCSLDHTSQQAKLPGIARVIDLPCNLGIGGAVQTGFIYACRNGYDYAVQIDGDGQHIPAEVKKLMEKLESGKYDMVIGSRFLGVDSFKTTPVRRFGIGIFQVLYTLLIKTKITDATSGFRAYSKNCIEFLSRNYPDDYPEPEVIVLLKKRGFKLCEIPVEMRERIHGSSSITPVKSLYYMVKVALSIFFSYIRS